MARSPTMANGSRRTRLTISVPQALVDLIPKNENVSAIMTQLIEDNIGRISSAPMSTIRAKRLERAREMVLEEIEAMSMNIAKNVANEDTKVISDALKQIDERIVEISAIQRTLSMLKDNLTYIKKDRYTDLKDIMHEAIKDTLREMKLDIDSEPDVKPVRGEARVEIISKTDDREEIEEDLSVHEDSSKIIVANSTVGMPEELPTKSGETISIGPGIKFTRNQ